MPIYYQNQSTVWYLGGDNITFEGFGTGTLDGNGQAWYDLVKGISNYPSNTSHMPRCHAILNLCRAADGPYDLEYAQLGLPRPPLCSKPDVVCIEIRSPPLALY
jgi:hypothetical protein